MQNKNAIRVALPTTPQKWNSVFYNKIRRIINQAIPQTRQRVRAITDGLTMPEPQSVLIGSAKRMDASILFFDLARFTAETSRLTQEQTLFMLNLIIPTVMRVTRHWNGIIEKNTGDGIMAIFGTETRDKSKIVRDAIEAAMAIRFVMLNDIKAKLASQELPSMDFRIGVETGELLLARIGIHSNNFLTAVGDAANRACKLQGLAGTNGICIGEDVALKLAPELQQYCVLGSDSAWDWSRGNTPYQFYHFTHDWSDPTPKPITRPPFRFQR